MTQRYAAWCLNHNNEARRINMLRRAKEVNLPLILYEGQSHEQLQVKYPAEGLMLNHLAIIRMFLQSDKEWAVIMEDDVHLHRNIVQQLTTVIEDMTALQLDIVMLGYLLAHTPETKVLQSGNSFSYYEYDDNLWGAQMYIITRSYAQFLITNYGEGDYMYRARQDKNLTPYSADWIITKMGKRALIYPMLAVEDRSKIQSHPAHESWHKLSHKFNYDPQYYTV